MMIAEAFCKAAHQLLAHDLDVLNKVIVGDDLLHGKGRRTGDGMCLISMSVHEGAGPGTEGVDDPLADENACDGLVAAAESFADNLNVRRDLFLFPSVHRPGPAYAAHDFIKNEQRSVAVADLAHGLEVSGHGGHAAGGGSDDWLGHECGDITRAKALKFVLQFIGETLDVLRVGLARILPAVGEAR